MQVFFVPPGTKGLWTLESPLVCFRWRARDGGLGDRDHVVLVLGRVTKTVNDPEQSVNNSNIRCR